MTPPASKALQRWLLLACCAGLADCRLIDQTTFAHKTPAKPAVAAPVVPALTDPRRPLVTITSDQSPASYEDSLREAVDAARERNPYVKFDVIAMVPGTGDPSSAQRAAASVGEALLSLGVPAPRIHLGLRKDAPTVPQEVRVYVHT